MGNPEPNPVLQKPKKWKKQKEDRCRDSMEAVLTNGVDCFGRRIFLIKWESIYILLNTFSNEMINDYRNRFCFHEKKSWS